MPNKANLKIAQLWFEAFNEHNLEKLLALYADDAQHYSPKLKLRQPETNGLISGKNALCGWWKDSFERLPTLKYTPTHYIADDTSIFMEYTRQVQDEEDMTVGEVLVIKNGQIVRSRVYHS